MTYYNQKETPPNTQEDTDMTRYNKSEIMRNKGYRGVMLCAAAFLPLCFIAISISFLTGFMWITVTEMVIIGFPAYKNWFGTKKIFNCLIMLVPPVLIASFALVVNGGTILSWLRAAINPYLDYRRMGNQ